MGKKIIKKVKYNPVKLDWEGIFQDFQQYLKRVNNILDQAKSKEQLEQVPKISEKLKDLIPSGTILSNINLIDKFIKIANSSRQHYFSIEAKNLGIHLLNSLMFVHGVAQSSYATQYYHYYVYRVNSLKFNDIEMIKVRELSRLINRFDQIILSLMEYLLKNFHSDIIEDISLNINIGDVCFRIIKLIKEYAKYILEMEQLEFLKFHNIKNVNLVFGPGMYYFQITTNQKEFLDYGLKHFEVSSHSFKEEYEEHTGVYSDLWEDFSGLNEIWFHKFGYRIECIISAVKILSYKISEKYKNFFKPYDGNIPVFNVSEFEGKSIQDLERIFSNYLYKLISNYFNQPELKNTFEEPRIIKNFIKNNRSDWVKDELKKIILELTADPQKPILLGVNDLVNHLFYYTNKNKLFFYIINYPGALRERLYNRLSEIDNYKKESVLINHIKRILENNGYIIHPLSGKQILNNFKKTIGEVDIIGTKNNKILVFIESKIIPQKKIDPTNYQYFGQIMRSIGEKIQKFNKNIKIFEQYCGDLTLLDHFFEYYDKEIIDINSFSIRKNFFITPYLIFYPQYLKTDYKIETLSPYLLEKRLKLLT